MAINLALKYAQQIDEIITQDSLTNELINRNIDWLGVKTVKVYSVSAAPMGNYTRSGSNRYGTPAELPDAEQELETKMDRSFTFTIDRGNNIEQLNMKVAGERLRQQLREKSIPEVDLRRTGKAAFGAGSKRIVTLTTSNAYTEFIKARTYMTNHNVLTENRMAYVSAEYYELLQQDDKFNKACNISKEQVNTGVINMVDGSKLKVLPESRMPFGCSCIVFQLNPLNAADKLEDYKIHDNPPGINGWLVEGRNIFDAFVLTNQAPRIYAIFGYLRSIATTSVAGTAASNGTVLSVKIPYVLQGMAGLTLKYKLGANAAGAALAIGDAFTDFTAITITPDDAGGDTITTEEIAASTNTHVKVGVFLDGVCIGGDTAVALTKKA